MEKQDIREYGSQELSMIVMNDEGLYKDFMRAVRRNDFYTFAEGLREMFLFDEEQFEDLELYFDDEVMQHNNN